MVFYMYLLVLADVCMLVLAAVFAKIKSDLLFKNVYRLYCMLVVLWKLKKRHL